MKLNQLNEAFDRVYGVPSNKPSVNESKKLNEDVSPAIKDLANALFSRCRDLQNRHETNIKVYEAEFQDVIEGQFPENAWWEVTDCNIFWSLFNDRDPQKTVIDIIKGVKPEFNATSEDDFIDESLKCLLSKLNEKEMSDEDKRDTELIRSVYNKIQRRSNARLTPEEQAVLDKYGINRERWGLTVGSDNDRYLKRNELTRKDMANKPNVNLADRARKLADRTARDITTRDEFGNARTMVSNRNSKKYTKDPNRGPGYYKGDVRADQEDRQEAEAGYSQDKLAVAHDQMRDALKDRKYHTAELDKVDSKYIDRVTKAKAAYDRALKAAEDDRAFSKPYHSRNIEKSQDTIDKLLRRK